MHDFRLWAPRPERVEVLCGKRRLRMKPLGRGWWRLPVDEAAPGSDYAFSLDGGAPRPDPRSAFQPFGIDGPSRLVDHDAFQWRDGGWRGVALSRAVLYELHVGTFSTEGTFDGAIERLEHLVALGIDVIEIMPVAEFSGRRGWGYDGVGLFAPHHHYGGPDGLKRLIDACHARGLGVVLDVVYNHLGPAGNYLAEFGPYFSDRHRTHWGDGVNFDGPGSEEVRRFVIDNALMWLRDYHCDGLRLDAVQAIVDDSATHVLAALTAEVAALAGHLGRPLSLMAESDRDDPKLVARRDAGGYGLDAAWADDWHHALHAALTGERRGYYADFGSIPLLANALRQAWVYDGPWSEHRERVHGRRPSGLSGRQFVVFTQNHDQVGNRAVGERSSVLMNGGRLRIAAALLLTSPFVPMIFQGEEWGASKPFQYFTDHADPALARAVSEGRRSEFAAFGWRPDAVPDPQDPATFERSKLDWSEATRGSHADLLSWYRELIALRRRVPALSDPRLDPIEARWDEEGGLSFERGPVTVAVNLSPRSRTVATKPFAELAVASSSEVSLSGHRVVLPPDTVAILVDKAAP
jgi:maltooligosyltrehalose trehalohydrolase